MGLVANQAHAWGAHSLATYRALENLPEVAQAASVTAEPLDSFLKAEEKTLEALLASHDAWAASNIDRYSARPAAPVFIADATRSEESRRLAFLAALRLAPQRKFALTATSDLGASNPSTGPRFLVLNDGDTVSALSVLATATDEPTLEPHTAAAQQPHAYRNLASLRVYQFSTLASLAFRTGHPYWGWRFSGTALHYVQDLTQPYYASPSPSDTSFKLWALDAIAALGWDGPKNNWVALRANQSRVLDKYQAEMMQLAAAAKQDGALEKALRNADKDRNYPDWTTKYLRDTVIPQSQAQSAQTMQHLLDAVPAQYVLDPAFDFGSQEPGIQLHQELKTVAPEKRARLEASLADLLANFGAHSRNTLRAILRASTQF